MKPFKSKSPKPEAQPPSTTVVQPIIVPDEHKVMMHSCTSKAQHGGYNHLVTACFEDYKGHLWLTGSTGRLMSQVNFCPFCGFQALNEAEELATIDSATQDCLTTPPDRPLRVWRHFGEPVPMDHMLFGRVYVHASDGCHAKVKCTLHKGFLTVCVENLTALDHIECPTVPKVMRPKSDKPTSKSHEEKVREMVNKYAGLV